MEKRKNFRCGAFHCEESGGEMDTRCFFEGRDRDEKLFTLWRRQRLTGCLCDAWESCSAQGDSVMLGKNAAALAVENATEERSSAWRWRRRGSGRTSFVVHG